MAVARQIEDSRILYEQNMLQAERSRIKKLGFYEVAGEKDEQYVQVFHVLQKAEGGPSTVWINLNLHEQTTETNAILPNTEELIPYERRDIIQRANIILTDTNTWPLGYTKFYLGLIPPSREPNPSKTVEAVQTRACILSNGHSRAQRDRRRKTLHQP
ncbi:hypothetical protein C8R42DRAFT_718516 [Lentinula raphanica]|nr:hypothetical protein C8R42DRAFT_718516 [Lentinula raphanica]